MSKSDKAATASVPTATLTFMYFSLASLKFVYQRDATANLSNSTHRYRLRNLIVHARHAFSAEQIWFGIREATLAPFAI